MKPDSFVGVAVFRSMTLRKTGSEVRPVNEPVDAFGLSIKAPRFVGGGQARVAGVEHDIHFHKGVNGSPGRASQFKALGYPVVGGHPHTPSIDDGVVSVGTCSDLKERWDPDCTTKAHGHAIQYPNGHVVLCLMHPDGRYEAAGPRVSLELATAA